MYTNIAEWTIAQHQFWTYMHDAEWWQKVQFVAAILGALCSIVAILICCYYKRLIIVTILGSQLEEFDLIKTMPTKAHAAPTLPLNVDPILTLFPPEADHKDAPMSLQQIMLTVSVLIMVVLILALVIVFLWKRFCFASNVLKTCFPWFPYSTYHCGIAKADIFVEVTQVNGAKSTWLHFMQVCCHPTLLRRTEQLNSVRYYYSKALLHKSNANKLAKHLDMGPHEYCFKITQFRMGFMLVYLKSIVRNNIKSAF